MSNMIIKMILLGLMLFASKVSTFGQNTDIRCEVSGLDYNLSGKTGYLIEFGSLLLFTDGKKEEGGVITVVKFYKLPRTKLVLSVGMVYVPSDEVSSGPQLMTMMVLGKKRVSFSSASDFDKFFNEITKHAVNHVQMGYPIAVFDKGGEGQFIMTFLGKKKPVQIGMTCKKVKKESK